ncbi:MAG: FHA domain-containing protein [Acidobacteriota bacterium]|nr:FHA domain-containing protein [Acidobacteriota bacterium]
MKLKLTLQRAAGHRPADLLISVDPNATVGTLADYIARSDPEPGVDLSRPYTLKIFGSNTTEAPPDTSVADSGLTSGVTVSLTPSDSRFVTESFRPVASLHVVSGPDAGKEFRLPAGASVIGRGRDCEIRLQDPLTSRRHAKIHVGDVIQIFDLGSVNGILIGDTQTDNTILRHGDTVQVGQTVISVQMEPGVSAAGSVTSVSFNRPPRVDTRYSGRTFSLPEIPATPKGQRFPIIPLFAPLLMGSALYLSTKSTTSLILMAMSPLMMGGNVLEGQMTGKRTYRRDMEELRRSIDQLRTEVGAEAESEARLRRAEYPSISECAEAITARSALLWSRRPDLPGFGELSLGLGQQPSRSKVEYPFNRQGERELLKELHDTFDPFATVDAVPVVADMDAGGALGVAGRADRARAVSRSYLLQLAALHSPAELAVYAVCGPDRVGDWDWLKWLPHCGGFQAPLECEPLASTKTDLARLLGELESAIRDRAEAGRSAEETSLPRLVVLVDDPPESERSRLVDIAERGAAFGLWVLWVAGSLAELPAGCKTFVEVSPVEDRGTASFVGSSQTLDPLAVELLAAPEAEELARRMSPIVDASLRDESQSDVPRSVSLLTLVGRDLATSPDRVVERWVENRSVLTGPSAVGRQGKGRPGNLRAVIGESATGPHVLDLRVHGPHALVGGTTGAGKSEMLQSWIVGMALSNSPQRLTFLLVDYKGGSAFSDCVNLPHTVGLVTDLSPHLVRRALTSLSAELRYREHILHRKRAKDLASLERDGDPDAPPSLVIVVDEFAALVKEVPEFVDGVVNVAQRGRSLGLHLILATQRPSGVIRDNLRANTNLRVALRMADVADSTDVIGTKAAAGFDPAIPGRAASRTGPTALIPFQTGYVGGWTSAAPERPDIVVSTWGFAPKSTWEPPVDETAEQPAEGPTDIQRLVSSIGGASRIAEIAEPRKPWLPELATVYDLAKLPSRRRDDELVFAVADNPANQEQATIAFRPDEDGNMAIFGTGNSGKSALLRTLGLAAGFTIRGGPVHVYGLDFGARGLQMLEHLPHVGSIIAGNDFERVSRLLSMLRETIDRRANEYAKVGAGSVTQYRTISGRGDEPRILLLVDGMGGMRTAYEGTEHHRLFESFLSIATDGRQVGVNLVIAADRAGAVPSALASLIQRRVVLRLAADNDYAMLGQPSDVLDPKSPPGRGLCDGLEIQVAILGDSPDLLAQDIAVRSFARAMRNAGTKAAPAVRKLEDEIYLDDLELEVGGGPAFAITRDTLVTTGLPGDGTFTVAGPPGSGRTTTLATIVASVRRWRPDSRLVLLGSKKSPLASTIDWTRSALDVAEVANLAAEIPDLLGEAGADGAGVVVIENLTDFVKGEADEALQDMIKQVTANGHLVISEGEPVALGGLQPLLQAARSSRVGVVLQPEQTDGALFRAQFPRVKKADFPPGRAIYVARGAPPTVVQVALAGSAAH